MLDRLRRIVGGGTMTEDLRERLERTRAEASAVTSRIALVDRMLDEVEEVVDVQRRRTRGASA